MERNLLLLFVFLSGLHLSVRAEEVSFFCEVDTVRHKIHAGQEVQVCYFSDRPIEMIAPPTWNKEETEPVSGPHFLSMSRVVGSNGNERVQPFEGFYYIVLFKKAGITTLPAVKVIIGGKEYVSAPVTARVMPAVKVSNALCSLHIEPRMPKAGQEFEMILTCNNKPDERIPRFRHPGIDLLSSSIGIRNKPGDKKEYRFVYKLKAVKPGSYTVTSQDLSFGGTKYGLAAHTLEIESQNYIPLLVYLILSIIGFFCFRRKFHKEENAELAEFVLRTRRLGLSLSGASAHYNCPLALLGLPDIFACFVLYGCFRGEYLYLEPFIVVWLLIFPASLAILIGYIQYRRLFFKKIKTRLSLDELYEVIQKVGAENEWLYTHAGDDCFVGHTTPGAFSGSWGEEIFVVFADNCVWVNSICDLNQRSSIVSFGRTKKNIRLLETAIARAEHTSRK